MSASLGLGTVLDDALVVRDSRTRSRWPGTAVAATMALVTVGASTAVLFSLAAGGDRNPTAPQMARAAYSTMALQVALVMLVAPALAAGSVSGEREKGTLDLLLVSDLTPWAIVRSKMVATVAYVGLFVFAAVPIYAAVFLHAGLGLVELALAELVTLTATVLGAALGVLASALFRRTLTAALVAVGLSLALCLDVVLAGAIPPPGRSLPPPPPLSALDEGRPEPPPPVVAPVRVANPLYAVHQVVADPGAGVRPWQVAVIVHMGLAMLFLAVAARLVPRTGVSRS